MRSRSAWALRLNRRRLKALARFEALAKSSQSARSQLMPSPLARSQLVCLWARIEYSMARLARLATKKQRMSAPKRADEKTSARDEKGRNEAWKIGRRRAQIHQAEMAKERQVYFRFAF